MSQPVQPSPKRGLVIAAASAALTLAAGITLGALLGYVRPPRPAPAPTPTPAQVRDLRAEAPEPAPVTAAEALPTDEVEPAVFSRRRHHDDEEHEEHEEHEHEGRHHDDD